MLQSLAQAIPTYHMCGFKFPKSFLHELNMIMARFLWGDNEESRKIHQKIWDSLCVSKMDGGLGFCDFEAFNMAFLVIQWWRIIHRDDSLVYRVLKATHFPNSSPKDAIVGSNSFYLWRSLLWGYDVVNEGSIFGGLVTVKKLTCIRIIGINLKLDLEGSDQDIPCKVASLFLPYSKSWNCEISEHIFDEETVEVILKVPVSIFNREDSLIWNDSPTGIFTVNSAYFIACC